MENDLERSVAGSLRRSGYLSQEEGRGTLGIYRPLGCLAVLGLVGWQPEGVGRIDVGSAVWRLYGSSEYELQFRKLRDTLQERHGRDIELLFYNPELG